RLDVKAARGGIALRDAEERDVVDGDDASRAGRSEGQRVMGGMEDVDLEAVQRCRKLELLPGEAARSRRCRCALDAPVAFRCEHLLEPWTACENCVAVTAIIALGERPH